VRIDVGTVLHATDLSTVGRHAERMSSALARTRGGRLLLLHVLAPPPLFGRGRIKTPELLRYEVARRRAAARVLRDRAAALAAAGLTVCWQLRSGEPSEEIVRVAREVRAEFVVMGRHRPGLLRGLLGSTSQRVIAGAPCPVLVVPATAPNT
jgi:nucleotide-binding universal stress UspA family protein